ncbi:MAG: Fe-S cluster assembly protein SufD [Bacteroidaceae bacterium]|nr:Fe-S cluster assembly protein SufD [Bacteroidaceae bacterium]
MSAEQQYIDLYTECRDMLDKHSAPVLNALREEAFANFQRLGFPTQKVERYKYTNVAEAFAPNYGLNLNRIPIPVNPYEVFKCDVPNLSTSLYFMVNDQFYGKQSPLPPKGSKMGGNSSSEAQANVGVASNDAHPSISPLGDGGAIVCSLKEAAVKHPELVAAYYGKLARTSKDAINALNTMLCQDGLFVYVPKNVIVERPIQIVNVLRSDVDLMVNRRVLIVLEQGASIKLLFCDHAIDDRSFLTTQVVETYVGENAHLELYELEETHVRNTRFSNQYADQQAYSTAVLHNITLHNGITRNRTDLTLSGEYAETTLNGLVIADKEQQVDNNTLIDHKAAHCQSGQLYKYVLDDKARCAFAGRVLVREGAQQTVSQETNANLLGSKEARIYTQPMLEIYADDVKCSHGSTVGQLGEQAMFYMQQRGIPFEEARMLLKFAFAADVLQTIKLDALHDRLSYLVDKRFRGELSKCEGCKMCK